MTKSTFNVYAVMLSTIRLTTLRKPNLATDSFSIIRCLSDTVGTLKNIRPFESIPGPNGLYSLPYIGSILHYKPFTDIPALEINELQKRLHEQYGDILKFRVGSGWIVGLFHPDLCREALQQTQPRYPLRFPVWILRKYAERNGIEEGIGTVNGKSWEAVRKPTQNEILKPSSMATFDSSINQVSDDMVARLKEQSRIDDTLHTLYNYAIENIGMLCFNTRLGCLEGGEKADDIIEHVAFIFHALEVDLRSSFHWYKYFRTPYYKKFEKSYSILKRMLQPEVDQCILRYQHDQTQGKQVPGHYIPCLVDNLLSGGKLTDAQLNSFIIDLFLSGIDSTAKTMSLILYRLALHQDKQEKLYEEIKAHGLADGQPITNEILHSMRYLKACIRESLRIQFPISGGYITATQSDIVVGHYKIPEKTLVMVACPTMIQDQRFFVDNDKYIPERWLRANDFMSDTYKSLNSFAFLPFGFGRRSCLGQRFAERELQIGITKLIQNFAVSLPRDVTKLTWEYRVFATPSGKLTLDLECRNKT
ncbi:probable cytochrome P450 49a1 isoform X2 [Argopecten irradians]|uniref:probable cytochrome P450 49a1 isoform X2 n=2 Tax=Argopecten irradians TaxID=31199 RepID=UPI003724851E